MKKTVRKYVIWSLVTAIIVVVSVCPAMSAGRFVAQLYSPPSQVSSYSETSYDFSAALSPLTFPLISQRMKRQPLVVRSSAETSSLTFNTEFYKRRGHGQSLVPVSADAGEYLTFRIAKGTKENLHKLTSKAISDPSRKKGEGGLGIRVALPKRLDRVFGEGGAGLKVSGFRKITFSGRSNWTDASNSDTYRQSKFPSLNMEQISQFDITGTIGSKITVKVSQNSQTDIPLSNRIQIRYKGDEDDILKTIEAGNTTLNLPSTALVGYSAQVKGLFGIKMAAQLGSLKMTAIASQEKGSADQLTITAGGEENATVIRDYEFAPGRIFDLFYPDEFEAEDSVIDLIVYETERSSQDVSEAELAIMMVDPRNDQLGKGERISGIDVKQVDRSAYQWYNDSKRNLHYVVFNSEKGRYKALGVWIKVKRFEQQDTIIIGDLSQTVFGDSLALRLLRHNNPNSTHDSWQLMWRNCYKVTRGVDLEDLDLKVLKGRVGSELTTNVFDYQEVGGQTQNYLEILGLDQYNSADQKFPDGRVDDRVEVYRPDWGLIIFPEREPFASTRTFMDSSSIETMALVDTVPDVYRYTGSQQQDASLYFLRISTKTRGSIIRLNRANIIEGSERVTVNGKALKKGSDYTIDYNFGQINLISEEALDPNAELAVDFEYAPFLAIQKKTLLGLRTEYEYSKDLKFGATVLYKSDKAQDRKPRVGQETAKSLVYDLDASLKFQPNFLTKLVDALPLVETEAPSNFSISGEIAQSHPNPNVEGIAYVDDFESALDHLSLRTNRTAWKRSSKPFTLGGDYVRGRLLWHTPRDLVTVEDVWDREAAQGQGTIRTFRMIFRPRHFETDTLVVAEQLVIDTIANDRKSWGGIMRYLPGGVDPKRAQLLEVRARAKSGKLHFDFGKINEDVNGDKSANSEDGIATDGARNGMVEEEEDVGLDGKADPQESEHWNYIKDITTDPAGDNWYFLDDGKCPLPSAQCSNIDWDDESIRYEWLNGTEGNINDPSVQGRPDEEALSSFGFNQLDSYFSYVIDFESDSFRVDSSDWPRDVGVERRWWTYRIPIRDSTALAGIVDDGGIPDWNQISHIRVWFEDDSVDDDKWDTVEVAAWYFVQSTWQDSVVTPEAMPQTRFVVAAVSEEDGTFDPPTGVEAYEDRTTGVTEAQRGLLLQFESLNNVDTCLAIKELIAVDNYSGYRNMEMYVYGGAGIDEPPVGQDPKIRFFFRIGVDGENFYEYRTFLYAGWDERNFVKIDFNEITGFKDSLMRAVPKGQQNLIDDSTSTYRVKGRPNLNEIRYFVAGLVNTSTDSLERLDGYVWLDELRVTDVRKDVGTAGRLAISGSLADLVTYSLGLDSRDPYFRGISSATRGGGKGNLGSGSSSMSYRYSFTLQFHKLLPPSWGARIPIGYTCSKSTTTPLLRTSSDIVLPEEVRVLEQSVRESRSLTVSESFKYKGKNILFDVLLNRFNSSLTYGRTLSRSVPKPYSLDENLKVTSNLDLAIKGIPRPPILFWTKPIPIVRRVSGATLGLYPDTWKLSGGFSRNISVSDDPNFNRRHTYKRDFNGRMDLSYKLFDNLSTSFKVSTRRDLSNVDLVNLSFSDFRLGLETNFSQSFTGSYDPKLLSFFGTAFSYQSSYSDSWDRSSESRHSQMSRSWNVKGSFNHMALLGGKSSGGERRFSGRRRNVRAGGEKKEDDGRPFYDPPLAVLRFLTGWIKPPSYSYSQSYKAAFPGMLQRPFWRYRFGFESTTDVPTTAQSRAPSAGEGVSYDASSGFSFLGGISCDVKFKRAISRDVIKQGSRHESISTSWPDLSIRIKKFTTLPLLKPIVNRIIDVFAPRTGYARSTKETVDLDGGFSTQKSVSIRYSPLLAISFKLFKALSLSGTASRSKDESEKFNPSDGSPQSRTRSSQQSLVFDAKYSFSAPGGIGIPIFGKLKFRSNVSITLGVKMNDSKTETSNRGKQYVASADKSDFSWNAVLTYSFSRQIKGGLSTRWQDSNDNYRNRRSHLREISIWTEIRF